MKHFDRSLPMMLYRTLDAVMPRFRSIFSHFGLTEPQWRILRLLWERNGCALSELSAASLISSPSLVGVIDRLDRDGLVVRRRSAEDRRVVHVFLTASGKALEDQVRPMVEAAYADLERSIEPANWEQMLRTMDQLIAR